MLEDIKTKSGIFCSACERQLNELEAISFKTEPDMTKTLTCFKFGCLDKTSEFVGFVGKDGKIVFFNDGKMKF